MRKHHHHCRPGHEGWHRGGWGDSGRGGTGKRFFGRGGIKYALLELLEREPMHGYQMMKALEEQSGGVYTPSPGSIYPTLQMMEDRGWITVEDNDGKKTYRIAPAGSEALRQWNDQWQAEEGGEDAKQAGPSARERRLEDAFELIRLLTKAERRSHRYPSYAERYRQFLDGALRDLRELLADMRAAGRHERTAADAALDADTDGETDIGRGNSAPES